MKPMLDVAEFYEACGEPVNVTPQFPSQERIDLRMRLENEEHKELQDAIMQRDIEGIADALIDKIYISIGTALEFGLPVDMLWDAVHKANMAKVDPKTGKVRRREDGKILKPEGWTPPNIREILLG